MQYQSSLRNHPRSLIAALLLAWSCQAWGVDTYNYDTNQVTIPSLTIGMTTYSNVVVTLGTIKAVLGGTAIGSEDSYTPATSELTMPSVSVNGTIYTNATITVAGLVSIGGVTAADSLDADTGRLSISYIQVYGTVYNHVVLEIGIQNVVGVAGGMPDAYLDNWDGPTGLLTIPAVQYGPHIYTNVTLTAGLANVVSVGVPGAFICNATGTNTLPGGNTSGTGPVAEIPLYFFGASATDGEGPNGGVIEGRDGAFYGTTYVGGTGSGYGTVFRFVPSSTGPGTESVLYSFTGSITARSADGAGSSAGLIQACDGNFYGTTVYGGEGGTYGGGTVYEVTAQGTETHPPLYQFGNPGDLSGPGSLLTVGWDGNLYGTTDSGDLSRMGGIYKLTPAGQETVLYTYHNTGSDGLSFGTASLVQGNDGNFYGTTPGGGTYSRGTIYRMRPSGEVTIVHNFTGCDGEAVVCNPPIVDGWSPVAALIQASDGNFYGTTVYGGLYGLGSVFQMTPAGDVTVLYSFTGAGDGDGASPTNLMEGSDGNIYGITANGGTAGISLGTVFRLCRNLATGSSQRAETVLWRFQGGSTDGGNPTGLIQAGDGNFYGTTETGGPNNSIPYQRSEGMLYELTNVIGAAPACPP